WGFDFIDLGRIRMPSYTVPVTVKSLVFNEDPHAHGKSDMNDWHEHGDGHMHRHAHPTPSHEAQHAHGHGQGEHPHDHEREHEEGHGHDLQGHDGPSQP
ncbi:MAG: hypothetical protein ACKVPZ_05735, partial [Burkholderiaceae bacterium]